MVVPKVTSEEDFERLLQKLHKQEWEIEGGQPYRMILVEESHIPDQSIFMINIHHTFGDGLVDVAVLNAAASNGFQGMANL